MEVVIFMCSHVGNGNFTADDPMFLMSEVAIRTLSAMSVIQDRLSNTALKKESWSRDRSQNHQDELRLADLATNGLISSQQALRMSFGVVFGSWIQRHFAQATRAYGNTRTLRTLQSYGSTNPHPGSNLHLEQYLTWMNGPDQVWAPEEVSVINTFLATPLAAAASVVVYSGLAPTASLA